jgi:poly(3-hydroxybutyrate) depolymerase
MIPPGWAAIFDVHGMIFVSAENSGNDANVLDRRVPLALLGVQNIMGRYPLDHDRVYIGGFSGGSRVALRVALAYPDVFRGALLNAGSDPIGDALTSLPTAELFRQFQSSTRIVYMTGSDDHWNIDHDEDSRHSMREWCVFGLSVETMLGAGHQAAPPSVLNRALNRLTESAQSDPKKLAECEDRISKQMTAKLEQAKESLARNNSGHAGTLLNSIDSRYGSLAAPEIIELAEQIGSRQ